MSPEELDAYLKIIKKHKIENIKIVFEGKELLVWGLLPPDELPTTSAVGFNVEPDDYSAIDDLKRD